MQTWATPVLIQGKSDSYGPAKWEFMGPESLEALGPISVPILGTHFFRAGGKARVLIN